MLEAPKEWRATGGARVSSLSVVMHTIMHPACLGHLLSPSLAKSLLVVVWCQGVDTSNSMSGGCTVLANRLLLRVALLGCSPDSGVHGLLVSGRCRRAA